MKGIGLFLVGVFVFLLFWWGQVNEQPTSHLGELSSLAEAFLHDAQRLDYENANKQLLLIKETLTSIPTYAYPKEKIPTQLENLILLTLQDLDSQDQRRENFWFHALSLYYMLDALAHPYQPIWLQSLQIWSEDWSERNTGIALREYTLLRPAMSVSLDEATMKQFDNYFSNIDDQSTDQLETLIQQAKVQQEKGQVNKALKTLSIVTIVLVFGLGYVAWRKKPAFS